MAENILQQILDAEKNAEAMVAEAQVEAGEAIKGAQTEAREQERKAALAHRELFRGIVEKKRREVQDQLDADSGRRLKEIEDAMKAAESRLDRAADMIVREVLADGHR